MLVLVAVLVAAGLGLFYFFRPVDDEAIINGHVDELVELAEKRGEETVLDAAGTARSIANYFADDFEVNIGSPFPGRITSRNELTRTIAQFRGGVREFRASATDRELRIDEGGERAIMNLIGRGVLNRPDRDIEQARRFRIEWVKEGGDWRIRRLEQTGSVEP